MTELRLTKKVISEISRFLEDLTTEDAQKLEEGEFEVCIKIQRKAPPPKNSTKKKLTTENINEIVDALDSAKDREAGISIIESYLRTRTLLKEFADNIDVVVSKSDRVEKIKENIVDATVGARLRSEAIQGKTPEK